MDQNVFIPPQSVRQTYSPGAKKPRGPLVPEGQFPALVTSCRPYIKKGASPNEPAKSMEFKADVQTGQGPQKLTALIPIASQVMNGLIAACVPEIGPQGGPWVDIAGRRCLVDVYIRRGDPDGRGGQYPDRNEIGKFTGVPGGAPAMTPQAYPGQAPQQAYPGQQFAPQAYPGQAPQAYPGYPGAPSPYPQQAPQAYPGQAQMPQGYPGQGYQGPGFPPQGTPPGYPQQAAPSLPPGYQAPKLPF